MMKIILLFTLLLLCTIVGAKSLEEETGAIYQPQSLSVALVDAKASELGEADAEVEENVGEVNVASVGGSWANCGNKKFPDGGKAFHCKTNSNNPSKEWCQKYARNTHGAIGMQWARLYGWQGHCIIYFKIGITSCPSGISWYQNYWPNQDFNRDGKCGAHGGSTWFYEYKKKACRDIYYHCAYWANKGYCKSSHYERWMRKRCQKSCSSCQNTGEEVSIGAPFEGLEEETGAIYQPPADAELELGNESPEFEEVEIGHEEPEVEHGHSTGEEVSIGAPFEEPNGHGYNFWNFYTGFALSVAATLLVIKFRGSKEDPASYALLHEEI